MSTGDCIILFDGVCLLCSKSVQFVIRHDRRREFLFAAIQSVAGRRLLARYEFDPENVETFVLITPAGAFTRSAAALEVARRLGGMWRVFALFRYLPEGLRDRFYRFVAARRFAWFGRSDRCFVPTGEWKDRFLE